MTSSTSPRDEAPSTSPGPLVVVIPAYEPDEQLTALLRSLATSTAPHPVVIVDDGSGDRYAPIFDEARDLGADVVVHTVNRGKGAALKSGFAHVAARYPDHGVVCADCDGQHKPADIARVAAALADAPRRIVLGARRFGDGVPARSLIGNVMTRYTFFAATGHRLQDTQTGLRAYPASLLTWLQTVDGDRFDYELNALLAARATGVELIEVPIDTVYLEGNASSHFDPVRDSWRIYRRIVAFGASGLVAFVIDAAVLFVVMLATSRLLVSVVVARVVSSTINFATNRRLVFRAVNGRLASAGGYFGLVAVLMLANYVLLRVLLGAGARLWWAKLLVEATLFVVSYTVQGRLVFGRPSHSSSALLSRPGNR